MKYEFNYKEELKTIGAIEKIIVEFLKPTTNVKVEELYLCASICEGKIRYFSKFKKSCAMVYTHLLIVLRAIVDNDVDTFNNAYAHYAKSFIQVFKGVK